MSAVDIAPSSSTTAPSGPADPASPARRRHSSKDRVEPFTIVSTICVSVFAVICIVPFWMILAGSFTAERTLNQTGYSFWPSDFSLDAYRIVFTGDRIAQAYTASIFITVVGTVAALAATSGIAWVIARQLPRVSRPIAVFAYIPMLFSGGLVPFYILVTRYLGLNNSWWAVIFPAMVAPFLVFVQVSFFRQIPGEILEAARMDGSGELRTFFQIVLPLSKPILAVIGLFYAVTYWNEWFNALLFISDPTKAPLQLVLQNLITSVTNASALMTTSQMAAPVYQLRLALTAVTIGPILLAYPFAQRYFVKGLTLGATKG